VNNISKNKIKITNKMGGRREGYYTGLPVLSDSASFSVRYDSTLVSVPEPRQNFSVSHSKAKHNRNKVRFEQLWSEMKQKKRIPFPR
jgi:hypothetical protein